MPEDLPEGMKEACGEILLLFHTRQRFVLTTHVNPDGDGIGSEIALASWLRKRGKVVRVINESSLPAVYRFLDPGRTVAAFDPCVTARQSQRQT